MSSRHGTHPPAPEAIGLRLLFMEDEQIPNTQLIETRTANQRGGTKLHSGR
jgi:hypothetical protein